MIKYRGNPLESDYFELEDSLVSWTEAPYTRLIHFIASPPAFVARIYGALLCLPNCLGNVGLTFWVGIVLNAVHTGRLLASYQNFTRVHMVHDPTTTMPLKDQTPEMQWFKYRYCLKLQVLELYGFA
ncbi:hypothetical protein BGZ82_008658 [Podila clonocystis]|nr:hypothetical protein BGZ82_008658 [Podila clonocystis]